MRSSVCRDTAVGMAWRADVVLLVLRACVAGTPLRPSARTKDGPACTGRGNASFLRTCAGQAIIEVGCEWRDALASECSIQGRRLHRRGQSQDLDWCRLVADRSGDHQEEIS